MPAVAEAVEANPKHNTLLVANTLPVFSYLNAFTFLHSYFFVRSFSALPSQHRHDRI